MENLTAKARVIFRRTPWSFSLQLCEVFLCLKTFLFCRRVQHFLMQLLHRYVTLGRFCVLSLTCGRKFCCWRNKLWTESCRLWLLAKNVLMNLSKSQICQTCMATLCCIYLIFLNDSIKVWSDRFR